MTEDSLSSYLNCIDTVPEQAQKKQTVEGQLWRTYRALAETEGSVYLLSTLKTLGLATNEVKSFVVNQTVHKKVDGRIDHKVRSAAMKSKLIDACTHAKRLRQKKNTLKERVAKKYQHMKSKCRRIFENMVKRYRILCKLIL